MYRYYVNTTYIKECVLFYTKYSSKKAMTMTLLKVD